MTLPTIQQEICIRCGWCCQHDVFKVDNDDYLELYWVRGHRIFWDPKLQGWFIVVPQVCQHFNGTCSIYENRPKLDREWMCPYPDGSIYEKLEIYEKAAQRILKVKYNKE